MKQNKIPTSISIIMNGKLVRKFDGDLEVEEVEMLQDVMDIIWNDEPQDKKARRQLKKVIKGWEESFI